MNNYNTYSDLDLALLLKRGDKPAYTEIYHRYKKPLYSFLWKRTQDRELIIDILQDVFLSVWDKRENINFEKSLSGYLFSSVRNRLLDAIAHEKVQQRYIDSFYNFINLSEASADTLIRSKEMSAIIAKEISALPPRTREVFELSRHSNLSRREIALQLGISEQTVKSHMFNALKILKLKLGSLMFFILF